MGNTRVEGDIIMLYSVIEALLIENNFVTIVRISFHFFANIGLLIYDLHQPEYDHVYYIILKEIVTFWFDKLQQHIQLGTMQFEYLIVLKYFKK